MRIQIAQIAAELLQDRKHRFLVDASLPASVRSMISVHLAKPWIQNFWTVAIRSQRKDRGSVFRFSDRFRRGWHFLVLSLAPVVAHACAGGPSTRRSGC